MILVLVCLFVITCYKWGDWRNWKSYYPTILFLIAGDFIASFVFSAKPLWRYDATIFSGTLTQLIVALIIYPCTVLTFLSSYKKTGINKVVLITIWVCLFSLLEFLGIKYNYFSHYNGWSFPYSFVFDFILFSLLVVHQQSPTKAWLLSLITGLLITSWFEIPALY